MNALRNLHTRAMFICSCEYVNIHGHLLLRASCWAKVSDRCNCRTNSSRSSLTTFERMSREKQDDGNRGQMENLESCMHSNCKQFRTQIDLESVIEDKRPQQIRFLTSQQQACCAGVRNLLTRLLPPSPTPSFSLLHV